MKHGAGVGFADQKGKHRAKGQTGVCMCVRGAEGCKSHVTETIYQLHNFARSRSAAEIWLSEHFFVFAV